MCAFVGHTLCNVFDVTGEDRLFSGREWGESAFMQEQDHTSGDRCDDGRDAARLPGGRRSPAGGCAAQYFRKAHQHLLI
jgi:hypothetical protein